MAINLLKSLILSTLESVTSWLDIVNEVGISELDASARDSNAAGRLLIYLSC